MDEFFFEPFYQIMRQRLLADRMVFNGELGVTEAKVVAVVPNENLAYREIVTSPPLAKRFPGLHTVEEIVRASLKSPDKQFAVVAPGAIVGTVEDSTGGLADHWAKYWRERYGV